MFYLASALSLFTLFICLLLIRYTLTIKDKLIRIETLQEKQTELQQNAVIKIEQFWQQIVANQTQVKDLLRDNDTRLHSMLSDKLAENNLQQQQFSSQLKTQLLQDANQQRSLLDQQQINNLQTLQQSLQKNMGDIRIQITNTLDQYNKYLNQSIQNLTQTTEKRLQDISQQVETRLDKGFATTTATFSDIVKRLAIIDEAQKKITELSSNVVGLQEILSDKRARGAFGEVQLSALIHNMLPETHFALQYTLSNGKRADCILFLPAPTGNIVIDAKFPLENYQRLCNTTLPINERQTIEQQFKKDIKKHISDIAEKYIIANETADGAIMFIPAEAIFAEIHANHPDLVEFSQQKRIWLVSPTTMMAILTTVRAVLKDDATRQQVHIIQQHLSELAKDFTRFQDRMNKLSRHINQAHTDVELVHKSSQRISNHFHKIEKVEFQAQEASLSQSLLNEDD
jgi:DNA recombination protein RmuC